MAGSAVLAWLKALHVAAILIWCAGLFYLPILFAAHPRAGDPEAFRRLRLMTRFAYVAVASPAAVVAILSGTALIYAGEARGGWLILKLTAVSLMVAFHMYCGSVLGRLRNAPRWRTAAAHLALVLAPVALVPAVLWLVLGKPL